MASAAKFGKMSTPAYLQQLEACSDLEDVTEVCARIALESGFERALYTVRLPFSFVRTSTLVIGNFPHAWLTRYEAHSYFKVDPAVAHCSASLQPYPWRRFREHLGDPAVRRFVTDARSYGLRSGISLGLCGPNGESGFLSFASGLEEEVKRADIDAAIPLMHLILPYLHDTVRRIGWPLLLTGTDVHLTAREQECLLWTAEGKTSHEVASILHISESTVAFHLRNVMQKLNVYNRSHAVAKAILLRLLSPQDTSVLLTVPSSEQTTAARGAPEIAIPLDTPLRSSVVRR